MSPAGDALSMLPAMVARLRIIGFANPYAAAEFASLQACVAEALSELSPREERILRMRFGIGMADHTLEQVGQTFGVTRERIRQIEAKALEKLRAPNRMRKLSTFAEG